MDSAFLCSCRATEVDLGRRAVTESFVNPLPIVESKVILQVLDGFGHMLVIFEVYLFVFYRPPQSFDEHIVDGTAAPIHADHDTVMVETARELRARELRALIGIEDLRMADLQRPF